MSLFAQGVSSVPRPGMGGALFDDTPATHKWQEQMRAAAAKLRDKYAGPGPFPVSDVQIDLNHWWTVATKFSADAPGAGLRPDQVKRASDNALNLLEARTALKLAHPDGHVEARDAGELVKLMVAPIDWLVSVGTPILSSDEGVRSNLKTFLWLAGIGGGIWALTKLFDSTVSLKRELVGDRTLVPPRALVRNPPPWAVDADVYETARVAVRDAGEKYDNPKAVIAHVYKQLGGRVG